MKKNNLIGKVINAAAGIAMLAGTAYAGPKEDLDAIRDYVRANPTIKGTIGESEMYGLRNGNLSIYVAGTAAWFKLNGDGKTYLLCDNNSDGIIDGVESSIPSRSEESFAEMDCLSPGGKSFSKKMQGSYESILQTAKNKLGIK